METQQPNANALQIQMFEYHKQVHFILILRIKLIELYIELQLQITYTTRTLLLFFNSNI